MLRIFKFSASLLNPLFPVAQRFAWVCCSANAVTYAVSNGSGTVGSDIDAVRTTVGDGGDGDDDYLIEDADFLDQNIDILSECSGLTAERDNLRSTVQPSNGVGPFQPKYKSKVFLKSYTLAPFVNESELLRNLVDMGVDLSQLEVKSNVADFLIKLDWQTQAKTYIRFLVRHGIPINELGSYITRNPWIFQQDIEDLQVRINYLESKNFSKEAIARIILKARYWLNSSVKTIDSRLGWLQKAYSLTGDEVRLVVTKQPKIIAFGIGYLQVIEFSFKEEMGFSRAQIKQLLLKDPKLFITDKRFLVATFDYVHNSLGFSHEEILKWPRVLRERKSRIQERHEFLRKIGRAQYDPMKPNFVSLNALMNDRDRDFCFTVAKVPVSVYNEFLKTL
ncbi:unnamed protein product [Soboliphyme baturini]|uniref:Transcription termination factor 3, mitochondrial n=1 Tax=Soboliphyme baturini TaxID=241478 RepID=A0A183IFS9_9BILA|nr:unnamed protein product [Soboliphyme baturini]